MKRNEHFAALIRYLPLNDKDGNRAASVDEVLKWLDDVVKGCNWHFHTTTCKKNGCDGTDLSCRLEFMRLLVDESHFLEETNGTGFLLRREQGNIVPYCRALMMAVPGNHMFSILPELSRYVRERYIYEMAKKAGKEVRVYSDDIMNY